MRFSAWSSLAISVSSALLLAAPAAAHVDVEPPFLSAGRTEALLLTAHNDRPEQMTGFSITAPAGVEVSGSGGDGWRVESADGQVTWTGAELPAGSGATFRVVVSAPAEPGPLELSAEQLYADDEAVTWPVRVTVTPPGMRSTSSRSTVAALLTAGLLVTGALLFLARRRGDG